MVLKLNIRSSASPRPALQHDSEYFFCHPWSISDNFVLQNFLFQQLFFGDGTGRDRTDGTDRQTNRHRDRQTFLGKYYFRYGHFLVNPPPHFFADGVGSLGTTLVESFILSIHSYHSCQVGTALLNRLENYVNLHNSQHDLIH